MMDNSCCSANRADWRLEHRSNRTFVTLSPEQPRTEKLFQQVRNDIIKLYSEHAKAKHSQRRECSDSTTQHQGWGDGKVNFPIATSIPGTQTLHAARQWGSMDWTGRNGGEKKLHLPGRNSRASKTIVKAKQYQSCRLAVI